MTLGQLRLNIQKQYPGTDLELVGSWVQQRHRQIIDLLPWSRKQARQVMTTVAKYDTGTVEVTNGSTAVTGTGTSWTAAMDGRVFRVTGNDERYIFTYVSSTSGTLDRAYNGDDATAAGHTITKSVYQLDADLVTLKRMAIQEPPMPVDVVDISEIDMADPARVTVGTPAIAAVYMDTQTSPPLFQVEFWPTPDQAFSVDYVFEADAAAPTGSGVAFLPWMRTDALEAGVAANVLRMQKDWQGAREMEAQFMSLVNDMKTSECFRRVATPLREADHITRTDQRRAGGGGLRGWRW